MEVRAGAKPLRSSLIWSPLIDEVRDLARAGGGLRVLVSPFASADGVRGLVDDGNSADLKVICRWSALDLATGIADLRVYPLLKARHIPLYLHPNIHLKLYVFANNTAFHSSANATGKGLGLVPKPNIEVGAAIALGSNDWDHLYGLFQASVLVDDAVYAKAMAYQKQFSRDDLGALPELDLTPPVDVAHSISSLPASPNPEVFTSWHAAPDRIPPQEYAAYAHDRFLFHVPPGLGKIACLQYLRANFKNHPFVTDIVALIRKEGTARFGKVKEWLQQTCSDRPLPYRWELNRNTQVLYEWLAFFFEEISWTRPGYTQVICWNGQEEKPPEKPAGGEWRNTLGRRTTRPRPRR